MSERIRDIGDAGKYPGVVAVSWDRWEREYSEEVTEWHASRLMTASEIALGAYVDTRKPKDADSSATVSGEPDTELDLGGRKGVVHRLVDGVSVYRVE